MKKAVYAILGLVILYLILCLVGPSQIKVERSIEINSPAEVIKAKLTDYRFFQERWSPWTEKDPGMKQTYTGDAGTPGHKLSWESDSAEVGKGSLTYNYSNGDTVMHTLYFDGQGDAKIYHLVNASGSGSKVTWVMDNKVPLMARAIMLFMNMDKMLGPDFEKGLINLKTAMESLKEPTSKMDYIEEDTNGETYFIGNKREMLEFKNAGPMFAKNLPAIFAELKKMKIESKTAPSGLFGPNFDLPAQKAEMCAVIGVNSNIKVKGFETYVIPGGKLFKAEYYGSYEKMQPAYEFLEQLIKEKGYTRNMVLEEYVTDPMAEKDTAKWLTYIYFYVKK